MDGGIRPAAQARSGVWLVAVRSLCRRWSMHYGACSGQPVAEPGRQRPACGARPRPPRRGVLAVAVVPRPRVGAACVVAAGAPCRCRTGMPWQGIRQTRARRSPRPCARTSCDHRWRHRGSSCAHRDHVPAAAEVRRADQDLGEAAARHTVGQGEPAAGGRFSRACRSWRRHCSAAGSRRRSGRRMPGRGLDADAPAARRQVEVEAHDGAGETDRVKSGSAPGVAWGRWPQAGCAGPAARVVSGRQAGRREQGSQTAGHPVAAHARCCWAGAERDLGRRGGVVAAG